MKGICKVLIIGLLVVASSSCGRKGETSAGATEFSTGVSELSSGNMGQGGAALPQLDSLDCRSGKVRSGQFFSTLLTSSGFRLPRHMICPRPATLSSMSAPSGWVTLILHTTAGLLLSFRTGTKDESGNLCSDIWSMTATARPRLSSSASLHTKRGCMRSRLRWSVVMRM